jgi:hypothetical protein
MTINYGLRTHRQQWCFLLRRLPMHRMELSRVNLSHQCSDARGVGSWYVAQTLGEVDTYKQKLNESTNLATLTKSEKDADLVGLVDTKPLATRIQCVKTPH